MIFPSCGMMKLNLAEELTTIGNNCFPQGSCVLCFVRQLVDFKGDIQSRRDLSKDGVLAVQMRSRVNQNAEVAGVGVGPAVGHGQQAGAVVFNLQASLVVLESAPEHTLGASPRLVNELVYDAVEGFGFEMVRRALPLAPGGHHALLPRAQGTEVLRRPRGSVRIQHKLDAADGLSINLNVEKHVRVHLVRAPHHVDFLLKGLLGMLRGCFFSS
mmetsp:Transcript_40132/g.76713  ORF Transcript_40132/g.76713 Transcript_40132/m.76713 type:complete len:214 (-) Transcript_40132:475-1116(-)